ncbi:btb/poz domain-containing [Anaeramoeba flamelloides]|uniref:Btb/poz domain-containing n=1 Tax=Anaeramoeba flamelloides TaxID=1746091 RepID=A0AAV7Z008_9EUKA|nr:btb/poz domain-containing [Anaeramoeba flamelloides]
MTVTISEMVAPIQNEIKMSDVEFLIGPKERVFYGHKLIFSLCSSFWEKTFFPANWRDKVIIEKEKRIVKVQIRELTGKIFQDYMTFIYQRNVEIHSGNVIDLLMVSKQFLTFGLDKLCVKWIHKNLRQNNALRFFNKLRLLNSPHLVSKVNDYVSKNTRKIFSLKGCLNGLSNQTVINVLKSHKANIDQSLLIDRLIERGKYLCTKKKITISLVNIRKSLSSIISFINFQTIPDKKIQEIKKNYNFFPQELKAIEKTTKTNNGKEKIIQIENEKKIQVEKEKKIQLEKEHKTQVEKEKLIQLEKEKDEDTNKHKDQIPTNKKLAPNFGNHLWSDQCSSNINVQQEENSNKPDERQVKKTKTKSGKEKIIQIEKEKKIQIEKEKKIQLEKEHKTQIEKEKLTQLEKEKAEDTNKHKDQISTNKNLNLQKEQNNNKINYGQKKYRKRKKVKNKKEGEKNPKQQTTNNFPSFSQEDFILSATNVELSDYSDETLCNDFPSHSSESFTKSDSVHVNSLAIIQEGIDIKMLNKTNQPVKEMRKERERERESERKRERENESERERGRERNIESEESEQEELYNKKGKLSKYLEKKSKRNSFSKYKKEMEWNIENINKLKNQENINNKEEIKNRKRKLPQHLQIKIKGNLFANFKTKIK